MVILYHRFHIETKSYQKLNSGFLISKFKLILIYLCNNFILRILMIYIFVLLILIVITTEDNQVNKKNLSISCFVSVVQKSS